MASEQQQAMQQYGVVCHQVVAPWHLVGPLSNTLDIHISISVHSFFVTFIIVIIERCLIITEIFFLQ